MSQHQNYHQYNTHYLPIQQKFDQQNYFQWYNQMAYHQQSIYPAPPQVPVPSNIHYNYTQMLPEHNNISTQPNNNNTQTSTQPNNNNTQTSPQSNSSSTQVVTITQTHDTDQAETRVNADELPPSAQVPNNNSSIVINHATPKNLKSRQKTLKRKRSSRTLDKENNFPYPFPFPETAFIDRYPALAQDLS
jgi:hypothetical protein